MEQMLFKIENATWQRVVRALYRKYNKEFLPIQPPKQTTTPLNQDWHITRQRWFVWQIVSEISI